MDRTIAQRFLDWVTAGKWYHEAGKKNTAELDYNALALNGEAGEFADVLKKMHRHRGNQAYEQCIIEEKKDLLLELGDVMWHIASLCDFFDITIEDLMAINAAKLHERGLRSPEGWNQENPPEWPFDHITYDQARGLLMQVTGVVTVGDTHE